jgi:penicillin amidase
MQNAMFADTGGNIGFVVAGLMPIRSPITDTGLRAGWNDAANDPFIPFEQMPQIIDPPKGLIVNANNKVTGESYSYFLGSFWAGPERAERIEQRLASDQRFNVTSLASIETDDVSLGVRTLLPRLLPMVADAGLNPAATIARDRLVNWDGTMGRDQPEPLIYHAWVRALARSIAAVRDLGNDETLAATIARPMSLMRILDNPERWCAGLPKEETDNSCQPLVAGAFATAVEDLSKTFGEDPLRWRWGDAHRAVFSHRLFASFPLLDRLTTINVPTDGDDDTVNRGTIEFNVGAKGSFFYHPPLYPGVHGPGLRMILNLADLDKSQFMQATGQSGNPLSSHYRDLSQRWAAGRYLFLSSGSNTDRGLILTPPAKPKS